MTKYYIVIFLSICFSSEAQILNAYAKISSVTGGTTLNVTNVDQTSHTFTVGGKVIIMQMQDNVIGANTTSTSATFGDLSAIANAGTYEIGIIASRSPAAGTPTTIVLSTVLANTYNTGANSSAQIITFRDMGTNFTTTGNITGLSWNGNIGGVIAFEIANTLTLQHSISANGIGFLGGGRNPNSYTSCESITYAAPIGNRYSGKGEGIYKNTNTAFAGARGKILSGGGGGNDVNGGGGGGGNYTVGGTGGVGWTGTMSGCSPGVGGLGGISLSAQISASRIFMGGGGGGGHQNDNVGTDGGNGGGIILLKATNLVTTGACAGGLSITANGISPALASNDGSGGGGAAGSIILQINTYSVVGTCTLSVVSSGGNGGTSNVGGSAHGGGGGGGQGTIIFSATQPTTNVSATTVPGTGGSSCAGCASTTNGTDGAGPNNAGIITGSSGPLPIELLNFDGEPQAPNVKLFWTTATEINNDYYVVEKSMDGVMFNAIGKVKAVGNTTSISNYELLDNKPADINYYRLKQTDTDGRYYYSKIISINFEKDVTFSIYPNPANNAEPIYITWDKNNTGPVELSMYDATGKELMTRHIQANEKNTAIRINDIKLAKGIYMIRFSNGNNSQTKKLIIE